MPQDSSHSNHGVESRRWTDHVMIAFARARDAARRRAIQTGTATVEIVDGKIVQRSGEQLKDTGDQELSAE